MERQKIPALLVFNKKDLGTEEEIREKLRELAALYEVTKAGIQRYEAESGK